MSSSPIVGFVGFMLCPIFYYFGASPDVSFLLAFLGMVSREVMVQKCLEEFFAPFLVWIVLLFLTSVWGRKLTQMARWVATSLILAWYPIVFVCCYNGMESL